MIGNAGVNALSGGIGDDRLEGGGGNDTLDGGEGLDTAAFKGVRSNYAVTRNGDGSYTVTDSVAGRDGTERLVNIEQMLFADQTVSLLSDLSLAGLVSAIPDQTKAIAAAYQTLLGGVPNSSGFDFLIKGNFATNFGAGPGAVFNDENVFINVTNALVQGNGNAAARFNQLAGGTSLSEKVAAIYGQVIPAYKQAPDGLAFLTRPEGLSFYENVARERGIVAETEGP